MATMATTEGQPKKRTTIESQLEEISARVRRIAIDAERVECKLAGPYPDADSCCGPLERIPSIQAILDEVYPNLARAENALSRANETLGNLNAADPSFRAPRG